MNLRHTAGRQQAGCDRWHLSRVAAAVLLVLGASRCTLAAGGDGLAAQQQQQPGGGVSCQQRGRPSETSLIRRARSKEGLDYLKNKWWALKYVCIEDETLVLWDPKVVRGDFMFDNLPAIDLSFMRYSAMRASFNQVVNTVCNSAGRRAVSHLSAVEGLSPAGNSTEPSADDLMNDAGGSSNISSNSSSCLPQPRNAKEEEFRKMVQRRELELSTYHYDLKYHLPIRYPTRQEADSEVPPYFSRCTVPILMYTDWPHNYAEYVIRAPALLAFAQAEGALDRGMTPVLALPNKLKADDFNMHMLRPFFDYEPVTFRDFSRPVPPETPSNHTAEGKAVRCFKNLIVARLQFGDYPLAVRAARQISDWFQKHHPLAVPDSPWREPKPADVLRILFENRPFNGSRQFWGLEQVLADCGKSPPVVGPSGQRLRLECIGYVFGARGFAHDMGVLRDADVIVAFHGAGAVNTIFMQPHRSLVEVRPFQFGSGSKVMWWPNMWMPQIARQSGWEIFFWGVNVEDKELCPPSPAEAVGFAGMEAIRDRSVKLRWEWLRPAIESIAQVNLSVPAYVQQLRNLSFLWQVDPGPHFGLAPVAIANATLIP